MVKKERILSIFWIPLHYTRRYSNKKREGVIAEKMCGALKYFIPRRGKIIKNKIGSVKKNLKGGPSVHTSLVRQWSVSRT